VTRARHMRIGGKHCADGVLLFHRRQATTASIMLSVAWKFGNPTTAGAGSPVINKPSRSEQHMVTWCVVRRCSRVMNTMKLQDHDRMSGKLMENATGEGGEVAVSYQTSGRCCGLVGNEWMLSTVFSRGTHGD
jgi:hypothetical protein